jgi:hypothetical protein
VQFDTDDGAAGQHADHRQATPPDGDTVYTSPKPTNPLVKILGIVLGAILGLAVLTSLLESSDDEPSYLDRTGSSSTVGGGYPSGTGDTQIYDSGSITTTEDGELIYSDSSGNGFSSGG